MSLQPVLFCMSPLGASFLSLLIILNGSPVRSQKQNCSQLDDLLEVGGDLMKPLEGQEGHLCKDACYGEMGQSLGLSIGKSWLQMPRFSNH